MEAIEKTGTEENKAVKKPEDKASDLVTPTPVQEVNTDHQPEAEREQEGKPVELEEAEAKNGTV